MNKYNSYIIYDNFCDGYMVVGEGHAAKGPFKWFFVAVLVAIFS